MTVAEEGDGVVGTTGVARDKDEDEDDDEDDDDGDPFGVDDDEGAVESKLDPSEQAPQPHSRIGAVTPSPATQPAVTEGAHETAQADSLLAKVDRIRAKASSEDQAELDKLAVRVRSAVAEGRWADAQAACGELADVLFYLEDS